MWVAYRAQSGLGTILAEGKTLHYPPHPTPALVSCRSIRPGPTPLRRATVSDNSPGPVRRLIPSTVRGQLRALSRHVSNLDGCMQHHGLDRSCTQGGVAGVAQGRQECQRQHCAQQPDGAHCLRLWYAILALSEAPSDVATEHMGEMFENARKLTLNSYQSILRNIHEKPSIIAQTHTSAAESRPVVALRPLYLCLQCPNIMTETDRDQHFETKSHCFCGFCSTRYRWKRI